MYSTALTCELLPWAFPDRQQWEHSRSILNVVGSGKGIYFPEVVLVESMTVDLVGFTSIEISSMFFSGQGVFSGWYFMLFIMSCVFAMMHILQFSFCFLLSRRI